MPVYLSASSINDFIKCSQKVMYRIKKTVPQVMTKEMTIGVIAHSAVEKGWRDKEIALSIIDAEVRKNKLAKMDRTNLSFMMDIFFLNFRDRLGEKDLIEYNFKLPLHDDVFIVGKMDRISVGNIYDWKSGRVPNKLGNDVQSIIYEWAFKKLFGDRPKSLHVASLSTGELVPYYRDDLCYNTLFDNIIPRMIRVIRHDEYERQGMFNHSCFRCPYKAGCLEGDDYVLDNSISPE